MADVAVGAITGKRPMHEFIMKFQAALLAIALIHRRGARKYAPFAWCAATTKADSTVCNNIDAMIRHLSAHSMGFFQDIEGLPHIFHLGCRAAMLTTVYYRQHYETTWMDYPPIDNDTDPNYNPYIWITPEEVLSLSKLDFATYKKYLNKEKEYKINELQTYLYSLLIKVASNMHQEFIDNGKPAANSDTAIFTDVVTIDDIFHTSLLLLAQWIKNNDIYHFIDVSTLTDNDQKLLDTIFSVRHAIALK